MRKNVLLTLVLLSCWPGLAKAQSGPELDVKALAKKVETRFRECPMREVVAQFDRKHHKQVWQKQGWGPPTDLFADVKLNDSVLYPYILIVEFSLRHTFGPERENKPDAESDSNLSETSLGAFLKARYRYVYLVGKDGSRLKSREFLHQTLGGTSSNWEEKPSWPDACWDQIDVNSD